MAWLETLTEILIDELHAIYAAGTNVRIENAERELLYVLTLERTEQQ